MGFGDLKSQLLKAGLVDKKQVEAAKREKKKARKQKGRKAIDADEQARRDRHAAEAEKRRQVDRERDLSKQEQAVVQEQVQRLVQIAESGSVEPKSRPNRRWYYVTRDGRIPYLSVDDELQRDLERGSAALVESPAGKTWAVGRESAERIDQLDKSWICCWHGRRGA